MNIYNVIILDESGSMSAIYRETLSSMNEVLSGIRKNQEDFPDQKNFVTFVTFEGRGMCGVNRRRDRVPIENVADFTEADYRPGGCTPLYDAMGKTLNELEGMDRLREKGWTLAYIGANQDAVEVAKDLHIDNALNIDATGEGIALMSIKLKKARTKASIVWSMIDEHNNNEPLTNLFSPDPEEKEN